MYGSTLGRLGQVHIYIDTHTLIITHTHMHSYTYTYTHTYTIIMGGYSNICHLFDLYIYSILTHTVIFLFSSCIFSIHLPSSVLPTSASSFKSIFTFSLHYFLILPSPYFPFSYLSFLLPSLFSSPLFMQAL